jgi:hypothetical protein
MRRLLVIFVGAFLAIAGGASFAQPQLEPAAAKPGSSAGPSFDPEQTRAEMLARIETLAKFLNRQADHAATVVAASIKEARASAADNVLSKAANGGSAIAESIVNFPIQPKAGGSERYRRNILDEVGKRARIFSDYASELADLKLEIERTPSASIEQLLEGKRLPFEVVVAIGPQIPVPPTSANRTPASAVSADETLLAPFIAGNGAATVDFPSVAAILYTTEGELVTKCTGTLVAANAVLTAGHCINSDLAAVYFQHAGEFPVDRAKVVLHPEYRSRAGDIPRNDLAIIFLDNDVTEISPASLNATRLLPYGTKGRIVGFGVHLEVDSFGYPTGRNIMVSPGLKLHAFVETERCPVDRDGELLVCWTYKAGTLDQLFGTVCAGDSGGPLLAQLDEKWTLVGVTSGGRSDCGQGAMAFETEVYGHIKWISDVLRTRAAKAKLRFKPVLQPLENGNLYRFAAVYRSFKDEDDEWSKPFEVAEGASLLRVAVNATWTRSPLRLAVGRAGSVTSTCDKKSDNVTLVCEFATPVAGLWNFKIKGGRGQRFQLVATQFSDAD